MPPLRHLAQPYSPAPAVILLDEGWYATAYMATRLRNAGCSVHIATATNCLGDIPRRGELGPGITSETLPRADAAEYLEALDAVVSARPSAVVMPLTEAIFYRLWRSSTDWDDRIFPLLDGWQRELLSDKSALSRFAADNGVRVPEEYPLLSAGGVRTGVTKLGLPVVVKGVTGVGGSRVRVAQHGGRSSRRIRGAGWRRSVLPAAVRERSDLCRRRAFSRRSATTRVWWRGSGMSSGGHRAVHSAPVHA